MPWSGETAICGSPASSLARCASSSASSSPTSASPIQRSTSSQVSRLFGHQRELYRGLEVRNRHAHEPQRARTVGQRTVEDRAGELGDPVSLVGSDGERLERLRMEKSG